MLIQLYLTLYKLSLLINKNRICRQHYVSGVRKYIHLSYVKADWTQNCVLYITNILQYLEMKIILFDVHSSIQYFVPSSTVPTIQLYILYFSNKLTCNTVQPYSKVAAQYCVKAMHEVQETPGDKI